MVLLKSLMFAVLVPGTSVVFVPYLLVSYLGKFSFPMGSLRYLGLPMVFLGVAMTLWSTVGFAWKGKGTPAPIDPPRELVVEGPYRWVRNPMYAGILLILLGESLYLGAALLLAYALMVFFGFHLFVVVYEEPTLKKKFGGSYTRYCRAVPRWIPRRKKANVMISRESSGG